MQNDSNSLRISDFCVSLVSFADDQVEVGKRKFVFFSLFEFQYFLSNRVKATTGPSYWKFYVHKDHSIICWNE